MTDHEIQERIKASRQRKLDNPNHPSRMPVPTNLLNADELPAEHLIMMENLLENRNQIAIRYLRDEPTVTFVINKAGRRVPSGIAKGEILGVLVAFEGMDKNIVIGWSKRCDEVKREFTGGVIIETPVEALSSNKKRALHAAILRGLTDTINVKSKNYGESSDGTIIPAKVIREVPSFVNRAKKYFKLPVSNVTFVDQVEGALAQSVSV